MICSIQPNTRYGATLNSGNNGLLYLFGGYGNHNI